MKCVCVLRGVEGRPIYTSGGWFPANAHMEGDQVPWPRLLLEMHLDRRQGRFGRTWGSADPPWRPSSLSSSGKLTGWPLCLSLCALCVARPFALPGGPSLCGVCCMFSSYSALAHLKCTKLKNNCGARLVIQICE